MGRLCLLVTVITLGGCSALPGQVGTPQLTAGEIMARVAANQDSVEKARANYVYVQHARVISRKGDKVMCEEVTESRVTPAASGSEQHLLSLNGRLLVKGKYVIYHEPAAAKAMEGKGKDQKPQQEATADGSSVKSDLSSGSPADPDAPRRGAANSAVSRDQEGSLDIDLNDDSDRDLVENMRQHMVNDTSKDGIGAGLFPFTSKSQSEYDFRLIGREKVNGRDVYHLQFEPKDRTDYSWKGQAYIDTEAFQPVVVQTALSRKIPFAVRMLLGTNVPGLGFSVAYAPQKDGLWFPASFGTEFKVHVLFFFRREIVISAENRDFEKTHVKARVLNPQDGSEVQHEPEPREPK